MLDHIGFPVADFEKSKAFYIQTLAPLGYQLIKTVDLSDETGPGGYAGFGAERPQFWIGTGKQGHGRLHVAFIAKSRETVRAFYEAALAPGARSGGDWQPYAAFRLRAFAAGLRVFRAVVFLFAFVRERDFFTAFAISQSPSRVRIISNKKKINQFDHFVDIEVDFARAIFLH